MGTFLPGWYSQDINVRSNYASGKLMSQAIPASWSTAQERKTVFSQAISRATLKLRSDFTLSRRI